MTVASDPRVPSVELLRMAVSGHAGWQTVRAIVADPRRHGVELLDQLPGGVTDHRFEIVRSKYKPARKLTGYYRMTRPGGTVAADLAVSWFADGRVTALRFPTDPDMPQLSRLREPAVLAALAEAFRGPSRPGVLPAVQTVRYRPGQRHILAARWPSGPTVYVKTDRADSGACAVPVARFLASALERQCPRGLVVEPLGHASLDNAALWWGAKGSPAKARIFDGRSGAALAALVGRVARAIHDSPKVNPWPPAPVWLGVHDVHAEAAVTLGAGEHIVALLPSAGRTYRRLVEAVLDELDRLPGEPMTLIHGDLKTDNLLVEDGLLRVLDLDRVRWGDPAHDLAKFLADLRWCSPPARVDTLEAAFRAGYGSCDPARWARAELLASLVQLKLAARRAALHDKAWPVRVNGQVALAVESFSRARRL